MNRIKTIDYDDYNTPYIFGGASGIGIINNTTSYIPFEFIKDIQFTAVKNEDGSLVHFKRSTLYVYAGVKNGFYFNNCDKSQKVKSFIVLTLISGKTLKTTHSREVIVK